MRLALAPKVEAMEGDTVMAEENKEAAEADKVAVEVDKVNGGVAEEVGAYRNP
jgi:hypothetical protein